MKNDYYCTTFTDSFFFFFIFSFFELSFINLKTTICSIQREIIITSLFRKLTKVSMNNFKIDISRISDPLEMCKNLFVFKSLFINQFEILSHVAVEALYRSYLNPFPNKPWFLRVCSTSLFKTLWEKEKLLVTSNFSISHSGFYPFGDRSSISIKFEIVVFKLFQFGRV